MGENDPISFYAVQEYLRKDAVISKPHRAVETLVLHRKSGAHQTCAACALYTNIQSREDSTF